MNDLRFAFRQLLKNPGFTSVAVAALAVSIGATTTVFALINAVYLKPLPLATTRARNRYSIARWKKRPALKSRRVLWSFAPPSVLKPCTSRLLTLSMLPPLAQGCRGSSTCRRCYGPGGRLIGR